MDPLFLGAFVAMATILVLFSGVSVALGPVSYTHLTLPTKA